MFKLSRLFRQKNHHLQVRNFRKSENLSQEALHREKTSIEVGDIKHGFQCTSIQHIKEYNMNAILLKHETTKTEYLHLERDDSNNVFSIGFRTTPFDSRGIAHILEHTVLCGSEKYPVRDPFFKMLNRSLATFMNAMTGPDYTFYPFSSQNEIDYRNLQKIYLDAVFKPNLKKLDFLQEGWRLENSNLEDKNSDLVFKGVVYNEMKGCFSETSSLFSQTFFNSILPEGTYGYVSGGDPLEIPKLTYEDLKNFHATYYHPSNGRIFSYGNFPLEENLKFCNEVYLKNYQHADTSNSIVNPQRRWNEPKTKSISCRVDQFGGSVEKQNQINVGYVLADIVDINETFLLHVLSDLMVSGPNSAFYKSLIEKNISGGFNTVTGYDNQIRDTIFAVGLRDVEKSKFELIQKLVNETFTQICEKGFDKDHIESVLHGYELSIKHQSPKFGLGLLFNLMPLWIHNGPILDALQVNNNLNTLKSNIEQPGYLQKKVEQYFVNNKHKLTMTMIPDPKFDEHFNKAEAKLLESKVKALSESEKLDIFSTGLELAKVQKEIQNIDVLPCLKIDEIVLNKHPPALKQTKSGIIPLQLFEGNTNGVTYFKGILSMNDLSTEQQLLIPFFNYVVAKFDTKSFNYRDFDKYVSKTTSGLSFSTHITEHIGKAGKYEKGILIASHCLDHNIQKMVDIWKEIFERPNFENEDRLQMLFNTFISSLTTGIIDNGHLYSMQAARALVSSVESLKEDLSGMQHINNMQNIADSMKIGVIKEAVKEIASKVLLGKQVRAAYSYSSLNKKEIEDSIQNFCDYLNRNQSKKEVNQIIWTDIDKLPQENRGIYIDMNIPVNYCAKSIPTVSYDHTDFPKLRVLSRFLTSKYLHPVVREQNGAYGGGAKLSVEGTFDFYSYRDPNSTKTLEVYDNSASWLQENTHLIDEQNLFESKLSILQQIDAPVAEYNKGMDLFLYGLSYDTWKEQRERILNVKKDDLIDVCQRYLTTDKWNGKCVLGNGGDKSFMKDDAKWQVKIGPQQPED